MTYNDYYIKILYDRIQKPNKIKCQKIQFVLIFKKKTSKGKTSFYKIKMIFQKTIEGKTKMDQKSSRDIFRSYQCAKATISFVKII